ncbi:MAG: imidazole glycerol phosphate synthase subunit HisH [Armatimonadota bacterium]|nr:imidazole glycerol phosphate synthase subunit HisH [Armatimonadota bacterium]
MIAIIDYKAGNLTSVRLALEYIGVECEITNDPARILAADRVIFPGVGAAAEAMKNLRELQLLEPIKTVVSRGTPFLGICLGTQVIFEYSEEDGGTPCIGLAPGTVKRFTPSNPADKIPQMGWNAVEFRCFGEPFPRNQSAVLRCFGEPFPRNPNSVPRCFGEPLPRNQKAVPRCSGEPFPRNQSACHPLFNGIEDGSEFYFVHSYYPSPSDAAYTMGETEYADARFASVIGKGNLFATQFHPERSGRIGLKLLENFSRWDGKC